MKMNDLGVPICGLKPAGTGYLIRLQSFATPNSSSSGGGLQPAFPGSIFEAEIAGTAEKSSVYEQLVSVVSAIPVVRSCLSCLDGKDLHVSNADFCRIGRSGTFALQPASQQGICG